MTSVVHRPTALVQREYGRCRSEFRYGSFSRTLPLAAGVRCHDVIVRYPNGLSK